MSLLVERCPCNKLASWCHFFFSFFLSSHHHPPITMTDQEPLDLTKYTFHKSSKVYIFNSEIVKFTDDPPELFVGDLDDTRLVQATRGVWASLLQKKGWNIRSQEHLVFVKQKLYVMSQRKQLDIHEVFGNAVLEKSLGELSITPFVKISAKEGHVGVWNTLRAFQVQILAQLKAGGASPFVLKLVQNWNNKKFPQLVAWFFQAMCIARIVKHLRKHLATCFKETFELYPHLATKSMAEIIDTLDYDLEVSHSYTYDSILVQYFKLIPYYDRNDELKASIKDQSSLKGALILLMTAIDNDEARLNAAEQQYSKLLRYLPTYVSATSYEHALLSLHDSLKKLNEYHHWTSCQDIDQFCETYAINGEENSYYKALIAWLQHVIDTTAEDKPLKFKSVEPPVDRSRLLGYANVQLKPPGQPTKSTGATPKPASTSAPKPAPKPASTPESAAKPASQPKKAADKKAPAKTPVPAKTPAPPKAAATPPKKAAAQPTPSTPQLK